LNGTGTDGTLGIKEIKSRGGLVFVQDPNEAEYDGMPQSAIASGMVDRVLPVGEIAEAILRIDHTKPQVTAPKDAKTPSPIPETLIFQRVVTQLRARDRIGLPPGFDDQKTSSLGLQLVHTSARQLGGVLTIASGPDTIVTLSLPSKVKPEIDHDGQ
jgi:two-component sensor histidine kinase